MALLHVLWVIHYPVFGGPHNRALRLAPLLRRQGVATTVVVPREAGNAQRRLAGAGVDVLALRLSRVRATRDPRTHARFLRDFPRDVAGLRRTIRDVKADVVVAGGLVNPHAALAAHREGAAVVWQVIDTRTPRPARLAVRPLVDRCADTLQFGAEALIAHNFEDEAFRCPAVVLRPSVDVDLFQPSAERRARTREELGIPQDAEVVGTVANVNPQKGVEWFVRAAGRIARERPRCWFLVIGALPATHDAYLGLLRAEIVRCGIDPERFRFVGDTPDVERFYPALDVKLITSVPRSEGTTTTALEALACGVPVVATDVGAVREAVEDGVTGAIVAPEDAAAIAAATTQLLADPDRRRALGAAGRRAVVERFSTETAAQAQIEIFQRALDHRAARGSTASRSRSSVWRGPRARDA